VAAPARSDHPDVPSDGQLIECEYHNPDGSVVRQARVYEDSGRVTEDHWWTNDVLTNRVLHSYDGAGRPASVVAIGPDGTQREVEICRYDDRGRKTKVVFLSVPEGSAGSCSPTCCGTFYGVEGTDVAYGAPGATTNTITYDDRELPLEASFHDANHALVRRIVFSRDHDGRLLSEVVQFEGVGTLFGSAIEVDNMTPEERTIRGVNGSRIRGSNLRHGNLCLRETMPCMPAHEMTRPLPMLGPQHRSSRMKPEPPVSPPDDCIEGHVPGESHDDHGQQDRAGYNEVPPSFRCFQLSRIGRICRPMNMNARMFSAKTTVSQTAYVGIRIRAGMRSGAGANCRGSQGRYSASGAQAGPVRRKDRRLAPRF
jgi:hypothetical protein